MFFHLLKLNSYWFHTFPKLMIHYTQTVQFFKLIIHSQLPYEPKAYNLNLRGS